MTERLAKICSYLPACKVFADVGCDHGYCTQFMLERELCERAYISDVSAPSLKKAETLLQQYVAAGRCVLVCADGLTGIAEPCDCVLIAGMGGEEIVKILAKGEIPSKFVLQPMKNSEKVRAFLCGHGCGIAYDGTFFAEGKFYDLICGEANGGARYTEAELLFGRDNLKRPTREFFQKLQAEICKLEALLKEPMQKSSRRELEQRLRALKGVAHEIEIRL